MREFPVYDENQQCLGYLILNAQMYFPYTAEDRFLGKGFFERAQAEAYLRETLQALANPPSKTTEPHVSKQQ